MPAPSGLRERKRTETRRAISDAALQLALLHGPGAVTVEDIAAAAHVSPRTVFNYFPSKEAAMLGVDPDRRLDQLQRLESRPADEAPLVALRETLRGLFTSEATEMWQARAQLARDHPHLRITYLAGFSTFEDDLTQAIARRTGLDPATDTYPRLVVSVASTALRVAVKHAIDMHRTSAIEEIVDEAFAAIAAGLLEPAPTVRRRRREALPSHRSPVAAHLAT